MKNGRNTERHLRYRIMGLVHVGRLKPGDPLPSIRQVARETGVDHRAVAHAYRVLAEEGLVEVRRGAGVYLAWVEASPAASEMAGWLTELLHEAWSRGVARADLASLVERCASRHVRCACVESNEDHMVAVGAELEETFSLDVDRVMVSPAPGPEAIPASALAAADLVVTTVFHGAAVRAAAAAAGKPCVVVTVNPEVTTDLDRRLAAGLTTVVIADPRFSARAEAYLEVTAHRGRIRFVRVDQLGDPAIAPVDLRSEEVLITRAARRRLGLGEHHLVAFAPPFVSPGSAREICAAGVGLAFPAASAEPAARRA